MIKKTALGFAILSFAVFASSCEDKEANNLAKAQNCLDKISAANYADAENCILFVNGYDSQEANIIKCSAKLLAAGLTTQRLTAAYPILSDNAYGTHKDAGMIAAFALNVVKADEAQPYCTKTKLKGFIYISNLVLIGSQMAAAAAAAIPGYDPTDPNDIPTPVEVDAMMTECTDFVAGTCNHASMGAAAQSVAATYCSGANADPDSCGKINQAVAAAGGDPALVSKHLFCLFDGKNYVTMPMEQCQ